jgi:FHA domain-containing protein
MGLAEGFERRLERLVEGVFSRPFASGVQPAEVGRRLLREMEGAKLVSLDAVYVPNRHTVRLSPEDFGRMEGLAPELQRRFGELAAAEAKSRRWKFPGPFVIEFEADEGMRQGRFEIDSVHESAEDAGGAGAGAAAGKAEVRLVGAEGSRWRLGAEEMTIGRLASCEVVLPDPNASRRHARLQKKEGAWWVVDLGSTNGTTVNDALIKERRLASGDRIKIGSSELEFVEEGA